MKKLICLFCLAAIGSACQKRELPYAGSKNDTPPTEETSDLVKNIRIDAATQYQSIDGFGASDCWTAQYVGAYWDEQVKEQIAELLFSSDIAAGQPKGIGLSTWRFNLGAGTAEQGAGSDIEDRSRRAECFLQADGTLDWTHQQGQQYFLQKAHDYGCRDLVMFSISPPVHYTNNGKGYSASGSQANLKEEHYADFAAYMADVAAYFQRERNITFTHISPFNEPQYQWNAPSQEGSGWTNAQIKKLATELNAALDSRGLTATNMLLGEAADWEYTFRAKNGSPSSNVIYALFDPASTNYVGNLSHVQPVISGHSYYTDGNWNTLQSTRAQVKAQADRYNLKVYQTEWSMLGDHYDDDNFPGYATATKMDVGLYMSQVIHHDLVHAGVSSWSYWTAMDMERWNQLNRFMLIAITPAGGPYGDITQGGNAEATPTLWVLGNYSRFVRPGYRRVDLQIENPANSFFGSAYLSPEGDRLVAVYTNMTDRTIGLNTDLEGIDRAVEEVKIYTTSDGRNLSERTRNDDGCALPPRSVVTLVYRLG